MLNKQCSGKTYEVLSEKIEKGTKVIKGKRAQFIFNEPFNLFKRGSTTEAIPFSSRDAMNLLCKVDTAFERVCTDFSDMPRCNLSTNPLLRVFIMGNKAHDAVVVDNALAYSNNSTLYWSPNILIEMNNIGYLSTVMHELGHVIDPTPLDPNWSHAFKEGFSRYMEFHYYPDMDRYSFINAFYNGKQAHLNSFSTNATTYDTSNNMGLFRYNPAMWIFFSARYGGVEGIKTMLKSQHINNMVRDKTNVFKGFADYLKLDKNTFAVTWLSDMMTLSFFRKLRRLASAKRYLPQKTSQNVVDSDLIWNDSRHGEVQIVTNNGKLYQMRMTSKKLEAFGFATYDLLKVCKAAKMAAGSRISITVSAFPQDPDDASTWVLVVVKGSSDDQITKSTNNVISSSVPSNGPFMLGVMHTKTKNFSGNNSANTAISYEIKIET